jgi:hypothetical protein
MTLVITDDPLLRQHGSMGNRALDVILVELPVKLYRCGKGLDKRIGWLVKTARPEFLPAHCRYS